jgi:acyl-CoA synthetase (AMP-forming)/AMP-acid ligase II/acyl carrier protein
MTGSIAHSQTTATTLVELLQWRSLSSPGRHSHTFLRDGESDESHLTYGELDRLARAIAARLQQWQARGERAILLYPPGLDYIAALFGCLYAGAIAIPLYPPRPNRSIKRIASIVEDSGATIGLAAPSILANRQRWETEIPRLKALRWLTLEEIPDSLASLWENPLMEPNSLAYLQYTSGSTGTPKGVMLTHRNLLENCALIQQFFGDTPESRDVCWLPPYHDMGAIGGILQPIYVGMPAFLMSPLAFLQRPLRWLQAISRYRATTSGGPNFAYDLCVRRIDSQQRETLDLSSWEVAFNGAEPIRSETLDAFAEAFAPCGFRREAFYPCYGLAEATLLVSGGSKEQLPIVCKLEKEALQRSNRAIAADTATSTATATATLVGCGQTTADGRLAIVDPESGEPVGSDRIGEIWVSGPSVARGYWNKPEETERTFRAYLKDVPTPFLRTGDLGFVKDGELFIAGRIKDTIVIRGRNYYPQDIEREVEASHPLLRPGCSAAFSLEVNGSERLVAIAEVERSYKSRGEPGETIAEIIAAMRSAVMESDELSIYGIVLLKQGSLPKTSSGKIQRYLCKSLFLEDGFKAIARHHVVDAVDTLEQDYENESLGAIGREELLAHPPERREAVLIPQLLRKLAGMLKVGEAEVNPEQPLSSVGLDSLTLVELKERIETELAIELAPATALVGMTIAQLARDICDRLAPESEDILNSVNSVKDSKQAQEVLDKLEELSDEQVNALLEGLVRQQ